MIRDDQFGVSAEKMCHIFGISRSAYYHWLKAERIQQPQVAQKVKAIFEATKGTYGSPRITQQLQSQQFEISRSTVARMMKKMKLVARPKKKYVNTTDSKHDNPISNNLLNRQFYTNRINHKWVSDITFIQTRQGWAYLTAILDLADRMIVSWHLSENLLAEQTSIAVLKKAIQKRSIKQELIFHSDQGIQYTCASFRKQIKKNRKIQQSMSRKANCWDNAVIESFFKTLKTEFIKDQIFESHDKARIAIFDYIERWYNTQRRHSSIGYLTPLQKYNSLINRTKV